MLRDYEVHSAKPALFVWSLTQAEQVKEASLGIKLVSFYKPGVNDELSLLGELHLSTLADIESKIRQTKIMSQFTDQRRRAIADHSANALRLFEEAKRVRQSIPTLPATKRENAMLEFKVLEDTAISESVKSLELEKQLFYSERELRQLCNINK